MKSNPFHLVSFSFFSDVFHLLLGTLFGLRKVLLFETAYNKYSIYIINAHMYASITWAILRRSPPFRAHRAQQFLACALLLVVFLHLIPSPFQLFERSPKNASTPRGPRASLSFELAAMPVRPMPQLARQKPWPHKCYCFSPLGSRACNHSNRGVQMCV